MSPFLFIGMTSESLSVPQVQGPCARIFTHVQQMSHYPLSVSWECRARLKIPQVLGSLHLLQILSGWTGMHRLACVTAGNWGFLPDCVLTNQENVGKT